MMTEEIDFETKLAEITERLDQHWQDIDTMLSFSAAQRADLDRLQPRVESNETELSTQKQKSANTAQATVVLSSKIAELDASLRQAGDVRVGIETRLMNEIQGLANHFGGEIASIRQAMTEFGESLQDMTKLCKMNHGETEEETTKEA